MAGHENQTGERDGNADGHSSIDRDQNAAYFRRYERHGGQVGLLTLFFFFCFVFAETTLGFTFRIFPQTQKWLWLPVVSAAATQVLFVSGTLWLLQNLEIPALKYLTFRRETPLRLIAAFFIAVLMVTLFVVISVLFPPDQAPPIQRLLADRTSLILISIFSVVVAPIGEEIYFRGILFPFLRQHLSAATAVVAVAMVFTALHAPQLQGYGIGLALIFILGLVLTAVRAISGSTTLTWALHLFYNLLFAFYNYMNTPWN